MLAILTKPLKSGVKTIVGKIISDGIGKITIVVVDGRGSRSIKHFNKSDWTINYKEEIK